MDPIVQAILAVVFTLALGLFWRKIDGLEARCAKAEDANVKLLAQVNVLEVDFGRHDERGLHMNRTVDAIFASLREINAKLDSKADK